MLQAGLRMTWMVSSPAEGCCPCLGQNFWLCLSIPSDVAGIQMVAWLLLG